MFKVENLPPPSADREQGQAVAMTTLPLSLFPLLSRAGCKWAISMFIEIQIRSFPPLHRRHGWEQHGSRWDLESALIFGIVWDLETLFKFQSGANQHLAGRDQRANGKHQLCKTASSNLHQLAPRWVFRTFVDGPHRDVVKSQVACAISIPDVVQKRSSHT